MMAAQVLDVISKDEKERMLYESQLLYEADLEAIWRYRERKAREAGREEGRKEGREEGRKEGREEGRKEGREEGRKEGRKEGLLTVAKNLKLKNLPLDAIADGTGISMEMLKTL